MFIRQDWFSWGPFCHNTVGPTEVGCFPVWQTGQAGEVPQLRPSGAEQLGEGSSDTEMPREGCSGKFIVCAVSGTKEPFLVKRSMECLVRTCFISGVLGETVARLGIIL